MWLRSPGCEYRWDAPYLLRAWKAPTRCLKASWGAVLKKNQSDGKEKKWKCLFCSLYQVYISTIRYKEDERGRESTHCPLEEWINRVMSVEVPGHTQFKASMAYLNSSSHTTWSAQTGNKRVTEGEVTHASAKHSRMMLHKSFNYEPEQQWGEHKCIVVKAAAGLGQSVCVCLCVWQGKLA